VTPWQFGTGFGGNAVVQSTSSSQGQGLVFGQSILASNNAFNVGSVANNVTQRNGNQGNGGNRYFKRTIYGGRFNNGRQ
jgi:hypothetical protein